MSNPSQADGSIHEDHYRNFLVNTINEEVELDLGPNAETTSENIYEVLCEKSDDSLHHNTVLYHLREKFDLKSVERIDHTLLQKDVLDVLPEQVEVCANLHLRPYYGNEDETDGLYHSEAKHGTTAFHASLTLYARLPNKRFTLAVHRLENGDTASSVLAEFLGLLDGLDVDVKAVYPDREFYDSTGLTVLQARNHAYVTPIIRWGQTITQELSKGWSRVIHHDLTANLDGHSWTVEFSRLHRLHVPERPGRRTRRGASRLRR